jgi:hypothetical protein
MLATHVPPPDPPDWEQREKYGALPAGKILSVSQFTSRQWQVWIPFEELIKVRG